MKAVKIFLASSNELEADRKELETLLSRKSKVWRDERNILIDVIIWEDFIDAMSHTRLQNEYNKAIKGCDIFVMLFWTKVGKFTHEEFDVAHQQFLDSGRPLIYTYFKNATAAETADQSLADFRKKLKDLGHFETPYSNTASLLLHFTGQLDKLYMLKSTMNVGVDAPGITKEALYNKINKGELFETFEMLNEVYKHANDSLNALEFEFINQPGNFNNATFNTRLRMFISKNLG